MPTTTAAPELHTMYAVQSKTRQTRTGAAARWVTLPVMSADRELVERHLAARIRENGHRCQYRLVSRQVTPWEVTA